MIDIHSSKKLEFAALASSPIPVNCWILKQRLDVALVGTYDKVYDGEDEDSFVAAPVGVGQPGTQERRDVTGACKILTSTAQHPVRIADKHAAFLELTKA